MAWDMPRDPEESDRKDSPMAEAVLDAMHAVSEDMCAGWLTNMEFWLWSAVVGDRRWKNHYVDPDRIRLLRMLSSEADVWWIHGGPEGRTCLPLDVWLERYAARKPEAA